MRHKVRVYNKGVVGCCFPSSPHHHLRIYLPVGTMMMSTALLSDVLPFPRFSGCQNSRWCCVLLQYHRAHRPRQEHPSRLPFGEDRHHKRQGKETESPDARQAQGTVLYFTVLLYKVFAPIGAFGAPGGAGVPGASPAAAAGAAGGVSPCPCPSPARS